MSQASIQRHRAWKRFSPEPTSYFGQKIVSNFQGGISVSFFAKVYGAVFILPSPLLLNARRYFNLKQSLLISIPKPFDVVPAVF